MSTHNIGFYEDLTKTRIDVYETLCPQQMLVHKSGKIKNWGGECRDVTPTNCSLKIFLKRALGGGEGGGGFRMDVNEELKFLWGGGRVRGGSGWGGQSRCEQRSEVFVKNKKKMGGGVQGGGGKGGEVKVDVNEELKFL